MGLKVRGSRRIATFAVVLVAMISMSSCVPATSGGGGSTTPPPLTTLINVKSGPAGSFIDVAPPGGDCLNPAYNYTSLQATLTMYSRGIIVTTGFQYLNGGSISGYTSNDPFVHLYIPPYVATGKYLVYLSCYSYLNNETYAPATFTVTAS